jgi:hypothetical protein
MKSILTTAIILIACCAQCQARTIKLLTIGNSFSGNATRYLCQLAGSAGHKIILVRADLPGCPMERHWKGVEAAEADPSSATGRPYTITVNGSPKKGSLKEILGQEKWDVVTIQQASMISTDVSTYRPYARSLRDFVKKNAPQAEVVIHETWAYRRDDPRFATGKDSQAKMYKDLRGAYRAVAKELGLRMIPAGDAVYVAETDPAWAYKPPAFDQAKLAYPGLPDQTHSMHIGWRWLRNTKGEQELGMDGHHLSQLGCYLAGCVWFEFLFNESVENNTYVPRGISALDARHLRVLAHKTAHPE